MVVLLETYVLLKLNSDIIKVFFFLNERKGTETDLFEVCVLAEKLEQGFDQL